MLASPSPRATLAPLVIPKPPPSFAHETFLVPNSYLVILNSSLTAHEVAEHYQLVTLALDLGHSGITHKFDLGRENSSERLLGYSGDVDYGTVERIRSMEGVKWVEQDSEVRANALQESAPWVS